VRASEVALDVEGDGELLVTAAESA
jgi:hypothetical protein